MRVLKYILWVLLFFYIVTVFLPKENFYFYLEDKLSNYNIVLGNESLKDFGGVLQINNALVAYEGDEIAQIDKITILPFILYNEVSVNNLHFASKFQRVIPNKIDKASFKATLFYPIKIWIKLKGDFGDVDGSYNIYNKTIRLVLKPQDDFKQKYSLIYANFRDVDGELVYESSFK
ncbi:MAG: hypothetical protein LBJ88_01930 [Campylobacteraceae bacterium]|jgi:hypothetical protein|nr:hypothetical protein [Campylobacteraceae bacterium]